MKDTYKCAWCGADLGVFADGIADVRPVLTAHAGRCFMVGDWVRWEHGDVSDNWVEGQITRLDSAAVDISISREGPSRTHRGGVQPFGRGRLRRIARPGQASMDGNRCSGCGLECAWSVISDGAQCNACRATTGLPPLARKHGPGGRGVAGPCDLDCAKCAAERATAPTPPTPALYDGLTAEQCLELWSQEQREGDDARCNNCELIKHEHQLRRGRDCEAYEASITPEQLTAARELWSAKLRQHQREAQERERLRVTIDQDAEDGPWR